MEEWWGGKIITQHYRSQHCQLHSSRDKNQFLNCLINAKVINLYFYVCFVRRLACITKETKLIHGDFSAQILSLQKLNSLTMLIVKRKCVLVNARMCELSGSLQLSAARGKQLRAQHRGGDKRKATPAFSQIPILLDSLRHTYTVSTLCSVSRNFTPILWKHHDTLLMLELGNK